MVVNSDQSPEPAYNTTTAAEPILSADTFEQTVSIIDASHYAGNEAIVLDMNSHDAVAVKGSINSNNVLIGSDNTLLDVSQSRRTNFLQSGKNNLLRLRFFSKDHVVVSNNQGTVQIDGFDSKDTLHIVDENTIYTQDSVIPCQNIQVDNQPPIAVIKFEGTEVQVKNTDCETIISNIKINDEEALHTAKAEVMQPVSPQYSVLYSGVLRLCETFIHSAGKSTMMVAIPRFVTEIFYRLGSHTREQAEAFGQEIQRDLMLAFAGSPYSITASYLAGWITSRLTNSPRIISIASLSAGLTTAAVETLLTQNISLCWLALQTSVALIGSMVGGVVVNQIPVISSWGFRKASEARGSMVGGIVLNQIPAISAWGMRKTSEATSYFRSQVSFWRNNNNSSSVVVEEIEAEILPNGSTAISGASYETFGPDIMVWTRLTLKRLHNEPE